MKLPDKEINHPERKLNYFYISEILKKKGVFGCFLHLAWYLCLLNQTSPPVNLMETYIQNLRLALPIHVLKKIFFNISSFLETLILTMHSLKTLWIAIFIKLLTLLLTLLKGVFAKNERGYRRNAKNKRFWSLLSYFYLLRL